MKMNNVSEKQYTGYKWERAKEVFLSVISLVMFGVIAWFQIPNIFNQMDEVAGTYDLFWTQLFMLGGTSVTIMLIMILLSISFLFLIGVFTDIDDFRKNGAKK